MKSGNSNCQRALCITSALCGVLGHRLRTPLSVISNELSLIEKSFSGAEALLGPGRCREIVEILGSLAWVNCEDQQEPERVSIQEFSELIEGVLTGRFETSSKNLVLHLAIVRPLLVGAFSIIASGYRLHKLEFCRESKLEMVGLVFAPERNAIDIILRQDTVRTAESVKDFNSFSELLCRELKLEALQAPLLDAVFWAHGCDIQLRHSGSVQITISFPVIP